jgi:hypothetical protein
MMQGFGWAKNPIVRRMDKLNNDIPVTLLYGSRSWVDNSAGETIKQHRSSSYVNVQVGKLIHEILHKTIQFVTVYTI